MSMSKTRSKLYGVARIMGDIQAVKKGPAGVMRRLIRRKVGKAAGRGMGKGFSKFFK